MRLPMFFLLLMRRRQSEMGDFFSLRDDQNPALPLRFGYDWATFRGPPRSSHAIAHGRTRRKR
jgi:hypothetical protein